MKEQSQNNTNPRKSYRRLRSAFITFVVLLLLFLAIAAAVLNKQEQQTHQALKDYLAQVNNINKQLQQSQSDLQQANKTIATLQTQFQQTLGGGYIWQLNEANYLARLAQYNLIYLRDTGNAVVLLQSADQILARLNDARLEKVRSAIAHDIATLQAIPRVDLQGILDQISALQTQATQLPLFVQTLPTPKTPANSSTPTTWRNAWKKSMETLQGLIVIRRTEQPIEPILPAAQLAYLQQNLQLILQQAQWAALRSQQGLYVNSLEQAKQWTQHYFANNVSTTQAVIQAITNLQKMNIQPTLPDLTTTLNLILQATNSFTPKPAPPVTKPDHTQEKKS